MMDYLLKIFYIFVLLMPCPGLSLSIWDKPAKIGYWFYKEPHFSQSSQPGNVSLSKQCLSSHTWSAECGFIDPIKLGFKGEEAFVFEQKEYKTLLRNFSVNSDDRHVVLQWQKFNDWAISRALAASYSSEFNIAQHPELDSTIAHPFSQFGNLIIKNIDSKMRKDFFEMLSKTSLLVFFTRANCHFCHYQAEIVLMLGEKTHIPIWNAALDQTPLPGFTHYLIKPNTVKPAQYLQVATVPTLFLYLAPQANKGSQEHWIRLATGLTSADVIENRILQFVKDYRQGLLVGAASYGQHTVH